jgi:hypothetical protein
MKRTHQWCFVIWFLAIIYIVPAVQCAIEIAGGGVPQFLDVFTRVPTRPNLRSYEKELEDHSALQRASRPWLQYAWFVVFDDAGEKVVVGRQGWLFYRPDVRYLVEPSTPPPGQGSSDPVDAIIHFRDQLRARGIHLMVVPTPGKPSLYGAMLTRRLSGSAPVASPTLDVIARLRQAGIETVDLFALFGRADHGAQPFYLTRDTHWSPAAAEMAAAAVAVRLQELGWAPPGTVEYAVRPVAVRRRSDIARMTQVPWIEASFPAEEVISRQVFASATGAVYRDDPASSVLVLGDSFLRMYQTDEPTAAGFIAHLARHLRQPVASLVNDGGASTLVRQQLARRPQLLRGKRVVIWEFVERDIRFGAEGWQRLPLPLEQAAIPAPSRNP